MKISQHRISACRLCSSPDLETYFKKSQMPLTDDFILHEKAGSEFLGTIEIAVCKSCGCSQNTHDTDMEDYYQEYTYSVQTSGFAMQFMEAVAAEITRRYGFSKGATVIEIGSGTGEQLLAFKKLGWKVLGIEPSQKLSEYANSKDIQTIQGFFDENIIEKLPSDFKQVDLVISSYTFDHIPKPITILKTIHDVLKPKGIMVHEVHDLDLILQRNEYCLFEHEHYTYLDETTMHWVLSSNGFSEIGFDLLPQKLKRANSLLVACSKAGIMFKPKPVHTPKQVEKIQKAAKNIEDCIKRISTFLELNKNKNIVAYGAGGRGVMTLAAIPNPSRILYMVDKNPKSLNCLAPGSHIPVFGVSELGIRRADLVLVCSFGYMAEIVTELSQSYGYKESEFISLLELLIPAHA